MNVKTIPAYWANIYVGTKTTVKNEEWKEAIVDITPIQVSTARFRDDVYQSFDPNYRDLVHSIEEVRSICQAYCDKTSFCVSVTETHFIYKSPDGPGDFIYKSHDGPGDFIVYDRGSEPGAIVGIIAYPRFPQDNEELKARAIELAENLRIRLGQKRVTIVTPTESIMLGDENA